MKSKLSQRLNIECSAEELQQYMIEDIKKRGFLKEAEDVKVIYSRFLEEDTTEFGDYPSSQTVGLAITLEYNTKEE